MRFVAAAQRFMHLKRAFPMNYRRDFIKFPLAAALTGSMALTAWPAFAQSVTLLNVSYDPTRELYVEFNQAFAKYWKAKTGQDVVGKSDGLHANGKWIRKDWQKRLPHNSSPYTSTIVLVVRQGNPKGIKDWDDLVRPGIAVITPNPKTSGGARWNYLAAWEFARRKLGSDAQAKEFVAKLYRNVPVLDTGARGSTISFAQRNQGDVLIAWENEAYLLGQEFGPRFDVIAPSISILAEPAVTVVDKNVDQKGTRAVAEEYLRFLYTEQGQDIVGKHFYRPAVSEKAKAKYARQFAALNLFTIDAAFGGWDKAARAHFADGASFDQISTSRWAWIGRSGSAGATAAQTGGWPAAQG